MATLATPTPMATFPTTPTPRSPRRLCHSLFPMAVSTTTAMATPATLSTTMARGLLMPILGSPTDTTDTATDSTGPTDTVPTTVDTSEDTDTGPMDIPTTDKDIAARFLSYGYLPRYYPNVF